MKKKILAGMIAVACSPMAMHVASVQAAQQSQAEPNIVYIIVDDQRYDAMGFIGGEAVTPNMDKLAKEGTYFKNAFVTTSLSGPSRASVLTGMYAHNHGMVDNNKNPDVFKLHYFPELLKKAGYQTGFFGKWHFGGVEEEAKPGFAGFDKWVGFIGSNAQGNYYPIDATGKPSMLNVDGKLVKQKGYITDELTDYAVDWLDHRDKKKPFMLYLGHKGVHADFLPAPRHIGKSAGKHYKKPDTYANTDENYKGKPRWVRDQRNSWHGIDYPYDMKIDLDKFKEDYYETLMSVDDSVGRVMKYLKDHDLDKNTIVMVMGDNGFQFGEHGLIDKRTAYEESIRVPLIAMGPGFDKGRVVKDVVANIDIAPTILDAANIKTPSNYDGSSFLPLASGKQPATPRAKDFVYEYFWEYNFPYTPTTFAIRTENYKYINYYGVWDTEELYDMQRDPHEKNNLIDSNDPEIAAARVKLRHELFVKLKNHEGKNNIPYNERLSTGILFRHGPEGKKAADFPDSWLRGYDPADKYFGFFPDVADKEKAYGAFSDGLKRTQEYIQKTYMQKEKTK